MKSGELSPTHRAGILLLFLLICASSLPAQTVANSSFETAPVPVGTWNSGVIPGWKLTGNGGLWQPGGTLCPVADGPTIAWLNVGTLSQDFGVAPRINTTYTFTIPICHRTDGLTGTYEVQVTDAGASWCSTSGDSATLPAGVFTPVVLNCPVGASQPIGNLGIRIIGLSGQIDFDNITLTSKPNTPPQTVNFSFSGQVQINGAPATGTINIFQLMPVGSNQVAALTPDASGNISGTVALATTLQDTVSLNVYNYDANGVLINQGSIMPFPGAFLANLHGISGFTLMLSCAVPKDLVSGNPVGTVANCISGPGTIQGTLQ
jgi:hypothetical protein